MSCTIGNVTWNNEDILNELDNFLELYKKRPIENNAGGMSSPHCFATYFLLKNKNLPNIVESGIWRGQSTWLIEMTCPNSSLTSIDPNLHYRKYISNKVRYSALDWEEMYFEDISNTICFFDDHQNALNRIKHAKKKGYKYLIFEDNYPIGQGDCVSLKQILDGNLNEDKQYLLDNLKVYYEFPPVFKKEYTRWGVPWSNYLTQEPLFENLTNENMKYKIFDDDAPGYTWICYVEL